MKNFDEGFDNILVYDYDSSYKQGKRFIAEDLIAVDGRQGDSLNGKWNFSPDIYESIVRSRWFDEVKTNRDGLPLPYDYDFDQWDEVEVPGTWNGAKAEYSIYEGTGIYFKTFSYEKDRENRIFLRIGAANYETRIWLNKTYLGRHLGGFTPFMVDVTDYIQDYNRILIYVNNTRKGEQIPSLHYDWFNYGGIHRDIDLYKIPSSFIKNYHLYLVNDGTNSKIGYSITVEYKQRDVEYEKKQNVHIVINELNINYSGTIEWTDNEIGIASGIIPIDPILLKLWSPDSPYLYQTKIHFDTDFIEDIIGFRTIETKGTEIILNGKSIFLKGMCVHEESLERGRAVSKEDIINTLEQAKELGCNFLRLTHYPHNEEMAKQADRLGILLWEEIPVYWALEFENPNTYQDASNQLKELILRDRNRSSVIIWSVGNENPDSDERYDFMSNLVAIVKQMDQTRLVGASCLIDVEECRIKDRLSNELDIIGINEYYGWYLRNFATLEEILKNSLMGKPLIITETGADAVCGMHSESNEFYSEDYQAEVYKKQYETLLQFSYIRGITPWILYDYASMRRMSKIQQGFNLKGIISKDRSYKKKAYYIVQEVYKNI